MNSTIQEVSRSASASAEAVHQAMEESNRGKDVVEQTMSTITILADEIRGGAQAVQVLGDESQNINQVLEVIRSIAEQTNLLALNAAIEAARAGDQGRGFAVVADEVRALAGRSQQATLEIRTMIERLQSGADNAVKAMAGSEGKTGESVAMAQRAGDALSAITGSVAIMADMSTQIASAAEEQSAVAEEINRSITRIAQIASQNVMCSERNAHVSSDLAIMSDGLRDMVAVFRV
jgi:methyl-accepting chemotaxis protein